jgi:hypothetical protein
MRNELGLVTRLRQARSDSRLMLTGIAKARRLLLALAIASSVGILVPASTYAAAPASSDITATPSGQAAATLAAQRLTSDGHPTAASSLKVIREADGTTKTMPKGMATTTGVGPSGTTVSGVVLQAPSSATTPGSVSPMSGAQYWNQINNGCLTETKSQGWMWSCWALKKMINDGYLNNDFFFVTFDGKTHSNGSGMHYAYVETTKNSSSTPLTMIDYSPAQNSSSNCWATQITIGYILTYSWPVTECENWYAYGDPVYNPGTQYTEWVCPLCTIYNDTREPAMIQEVETRENGSPIWNLYYDFQ